MNEIIVAKNEERIRSCNVCYANNFKESYDSKKVDLLFDVKIGCQVSCLCRNCLNRLIGAAVTANASLNDWGKTIMMFKCCECGHLFEEGEQAVWEEKHGLDTPPYEKWSGCPICNGGYEEVHQCKECGDWHTEDELYEGWCEKCLRETINYDTFFEYCEANKDENYLDVFVMSEFLDMDMPKHYSYDFHQLMIEAYKERVSLAKMYPQTNVCDFLASCIRFIMEDEGSIGRENYADWLNKREVK